MRFILQQRNSNFCGHACVAMIAGMTIQKILNESNMPRGLTKVQHLRDGLSNYEIALGERRTGRPIIGQEAICRVKWQNNRSHWIVCTSLGDIYDPAFGINPTWPIGSRVTSHYLVDRQ